MKDQDYIKAGVELADGFSIAVGGLFQTPRGNAVEYTVFNDALAAQLVRQYYDAGGKALLWREGDPMTTSKAIVDSKVLKE